MRKSTFYFKQFECSHGTGSMKIGVDAVLIGAWAMVDNARTILDVGTGCGVIALMCAQRNNRAIIEAIDVDEASVAEAAENFGNSQWSDRLSALHQDFNNISGKRYDLIVSNPPYFDSGVSNPDTPRLVARHQSDLSPFRLLERAADLLTDTGRVTMVVPAEQAIALRDAARSVGLKLVRGTWVRGHENAPVKRILAEFARIGEELCLDNISVFTLETAPGCPSDEHRHLCKDFYLKF